MTHEPRFELCQTCGNREPGVKTCTHCGRRLVAEKYAVELVPGDVLSLHGGMVLVKVEKLMPQVLAGMVAAILVNPQNGEPLDFGPLEKVEVIR